MRTNYLNFLRQLIDEKYFQVYDKLTVIADRLLNGYYVVIYEIEV